MADKKMRNTSEDPKDMTREAQAARADEIAQEMKRLVKELEDMPELDPTAFIHVTFRDESDTEAGSTMYAGSGGHPMNLAVTLLQNPEFAKIVPYLDAAGIMLREAERLEKEGGDR